MRGSLPFLAVIGLALCAVGCAGTDYDGHPEHRTVAEAKVWAQEVSFITGDPELDGTYAVTVKYDNHGGRDPKMRITTYRNPVPSSFSRDGMIDRDGDDVQGRSGILGGKFQTRYVAVDPATGCQFFANIVQTHGPDPTIAVCQAGGLEEIDRDFELQASFASMGDLISQIWSGAVDGAFTAELERITLGGVEVPLGEALPIGARSNGLRPMQLSVDLTGPGGDALLQALLDHTDHGKLTTVGLGFAGGMSIDLPASMRVAFNHEVLERLR